MPIGGYMIFDERSLLSDKQDLTGAVDAVGVASTNSYDLGLPGTTYDGVPLSRNIGKAGMIAFLVQITELIVGAGITGVQFDFETDDNAGFASPKKVMGVLVPIAELVPGYILPMDKLPRSLTERYFRMFYTPVGGNITDGNVHAGVVAAVDGSYQG